MVMVDTEPPYGVIWNDLKDGYVIPFLGAGASIVRQPTNEPDCWLFHLKDFKDLTRLVTKLRDSQNLLSVYLRKKFNADTNKLLDDYDDSTAPSETLLEALIDELNQVIQGLSLFEEKLFSDFALTVHTRRLVQRSFQQKEYTCLNRFLLEDAYSNEIEKCPARWNQKNPFFLPSGLELAYFLADEASYPSSEPIDLDDLAKVSSYYADISGRKRLRKRLRGVLNRDYQCGELHQFLAEIPANLVIIVTNYDTLVEQAFNDAKKPYDLVIHPTDNKDIANSVLWWPHKADEPLAVPPNQLDIDLSNTTVIYKMHGTVIRGDTNKWDNFVITEEDYVDFLSRMTTRSAIPHLFYKYFWERSFLFLGYGLRDWNLRVVLKNLSKEFSSRQRSNMVEDEDILPSWAIQYRPSELEKKLWQKRGVEMFNITLDEFISKLRDKQRSS